MKKINTLFLVGLCLLLMPVLNPLSAQCVNADFSYGNFTGWTGTYFATCTSTTFSICTCSATNPLYTTGFNQGPNNNSVSDSAHEYNQVITTAAGGLDPNITTIGGSLPVVYPGGSGFSARIGSMWQGLMANSNNIGDGETVSYTFLVTPANSSFIYHYAVVLNDGGHNPGEQPYFSVKMTDSSNNPIPAAAYEADATTAQALGGYNYNAGAYLYWKPWSSVLVPLSAYLGQTVTITFTTRGCLPSGCAGSHYCYAYIACECAPVTNIVFSPGTGCGGLLPSLTAPAGAASYSWTGPGIIGPSNTPTINIGQTGNYVVTMISLANPPDTTILDTTIAITQSFMLANFSASNTCVGGTTVFADLSVPRDSAISWAWDFNNDSIIDSVSENPTHTFPAAGTYPVRLIVHSSNCSVDTTIYVVVDSIRNATITASSPVCKGDTSVVVYTGNGLNTDTYNWNFDGAVIDSGSGAGPYLLSWNSAGTRNITLTLATGGCNSPMVTVPVIVNAIPVIMVNGDTAVCNGAQIILTATGASAFVWAADTSLFNTASITVSPDSTATYIVTGTTNGCSSTDSVSVTVNPDPVAAFITSGVICVGDTLTVTFTGSAIANATFNWNLGTGLANTLTGAGPIEVVWDSLGFSPVSLTVSQYGCVSTFADTVPVQLCNGIAHVNTNQINIYPNPAKSQFTIQITGAVNFGQLEIYDVLGQSLYTEEIKNVATGLNRQIHLEIAAGVYFVSLRDGDKHYTQKVVME